MQRKGQPARATMFRILTLQQPLFCGIILFCIQAVDLACAEPLSAPDPLEETAGPAYFHIWPNQTVYYSFHFALSDTDREVYKAAMDKWAESTCLNFVRSLTEHQNHILFLTSSDLGCSSSVGMKGGAQVISMSDSCWSEGHALHLIGHAIGLWHEHSRPDRDNYIEVLYENIVSSEQDNFGKLTDSKFQLVPDVGYDIESVMHYGPYAFSDGSGEPTIKLKPNAPLDYKNCTNLLQMGQRDQLSYLDRLRVNKLYSCTAQVNQLEAAGRECLPSKTTTIHDVTPTTSPPVTPITSSPPFRLKSGSVITLRVERPGVKQLRGVICKSNCTSSRCIKFSNGQSTCDLLDYQFELIVRNKPDAKKVRSGDEVGLRLRRDPTLWLDCSNSSSACSTTRCINNSADFTSNASVSTCSRHHFKIIGVDRREGRLLNTKHSIQIKHKSNGAFMNCNDNNVCKFSPEEATFEFRILQ